MLLRTVPPLLITLLAALLGQTAAPAVPSAAPDPAAPLARGLILTLTSETQTPGSAAYAKDVQSSRLLALHIPKGQRGSPFLPEPAYHARWDGAINVGLRGRYTFSVEGRGQFTLTINGTKVLESKDGDLGKTPAAEKIRLNKGENIIVAEYQWSTREGADVRVFWQSDEFPREPIPPMVFTHDPKHQFLVEGSRLREGRELFATLRCVKCHLTGDLDKAVDQRMPELSADAPRLTDVASRLNVQWMAHWVQSPRTFRGDATMPHLLPEGEKDASGHPQPSEKAWDIAAYLDTLGEKPLVRDRKPDSPETLAAGGNLFASLGCIGCHTLPDHGDDKTIDGRVPMKFLTVKWRREALPAFLMNPQAHYAWNRMPNFKLTADEASLLTAFLWSRVATGLPGPVKRGDPAIGEQLTRSLGCMNCHEIKPPAHLENAHAAPPLTAVVKAAKSGPAGCLADGAKRGRAPDFGFEGRRAEVVGMFLASAVTSIDRDTATEFATRQVRLAQCTACHKRDGDNDRWSNHEGEVASLIIKPPAQEKPKPDDFDEGDPTAKKEAQIDQSRPDLTWVGDKLKPQWMEQFLLGKLDYKLRPWLTARMPAFPARAHLLAQGLGMQHGLSPVAPEEPKPDAEAAKIGRQLVGPVAEGKAGFSCTQCHGIGAKPATNVFEAQGINFAYAKERLRHDYFMRWMLLPTRVQPGTRMPKFASEDGTTPFTDVYGGDARKQFEAMWQYLLQGREMTPP